MIQFKKWKYDLTKHNGSAWFGSPKLKSEKKAKKRWKVVMLKQIWAS